MKIALEVKRYNPESGPESYIQTFRLETDPTERLLDVLMHIRRNMDPSLGLRRSCGHGVCGSDAMVINGRERLACKTLIKDLAASDGAVIRVEPLRTFPVQKDLMVDQARFFACYRQVKPFLITKEIVPDKEWIQSPEQRRAIDEATRCILCASCTSACPVIQQKNPEYLGPAAVVQAARFFEDSRDRGIEERTPDLDYPDGIWPCANYFRCTRVCPRSIKVTKLINQTKRKIIDFRKIRGEQINDKRSG